MDGPKELEGKKRKLEKPQLRVIEGGLAGLGRPRKDQLPSADTYNFRKALETLGKPENEPGARSDTYEIPKSEPNE